VKLGFYGKLPAHGDFLSRNLSDGFVHGWDDWMQRAIASSQEQLGSNWLNMYLTSPLWRFVLSPGVVDHQAWAGVMMPSVDKIGRYFPLVIASPCQQGSTVTDVMVNAGHWFEQLEAIALSGLDENVTVETVAEALATVEPLAAPTMSEGKVTTNSGNGALTRPTVIKMEQEQQSPLSCFPFLLDSFLQQRLPSYSLWWSVGSEHVTPSFLTSVHLPPAQMFTAMLDGQWQDWNWNMPFDVVPGKKGEQGQETDETD